MIRKTITLFCLLLVCSVQAQELDITETNQNGISIGFLNNKFGIYDKTKKTLAQPIYDAINLIEYGYFVTEIGGKKGLFDPKGVELAKPEYEAINIQSKKEPLIFLTKNGVERALVNQKLAYLYNTVSTGDSFYYVSQNEVTVAEYLAFLLTNTESYPDTYKSSELLPDTTKMAANVKLIFRKLLAVTQDPNDEKVWTSYKIKYNFRRKVRLPKAIVEDKKLVSFLDLPITGVSYKQANNFLKWYNNYLNEIWGWGFAYKLRLPTPAEWETLVGNGLRQQNKAAGILDSLNAERCMLYNTIPNKEVCSNYAGKEKLYGDNVAAVFSYNPDLNGLYNVFGNVAEMTSVEGVAKGGSFIHYASQSVITKQQNYTGPEQWLGFRWIVEYVPN